MMTWWNTQILWAPRNLLPSFHLKTLMTRSPISCSLKFTHWITLVQTLPIVMHIFDVKVTIITGLLSLATVVTAQKNVTVPVTDPTIQVRSSVHGRQLLAKNLKYLFILRQYSGTGTGPALICKVDSNGFFVGGQAGCYNVPSNCTDSIAAGQSLDSAASFKFKGAYLSNGLFCLERLNPQFRVCNLHHWPFVFPLSHLHRHTRRQLYRCWWSKSFRTFHLLFPIFCLKSWPERWTYHTPQRQRGLSKS